MINHVNKFEKPDLIIIREPAVFISNILLKYINKYNIIFRQNNPLGGLSIKKNARTPFFGKGQFSSKGLFFGKP